MSFLQSYKRLDNLCKDVCRSDRGVSSYIEAMERIPSGAVRVPGWKDDYYKLKHYRYIRNKIVHDVGAEEAVLCSAADIVWIDRFYNRILNRQDPLSVYRKAAPRRPVRPRTGCLGSVVFCLGTALMLASVLLFFL